MGGGGVGTYAEWMGEVVGFGNAVWRGEVVEK